MAPARTSRPTFEASVGDGVLVKQGASPEEHLETELAQLTQRLGAFVPTHRDRKALSPSVAFSKSKPAVSVIGNTGTPQARAPSPRVGKSIVVRSEEWAKAKAMVVKGTEDDEASEIWDPAQQSKGPWIPAPGRTSRRGPNEVPFLRFKVLRHAFARWVRAHHPDEQLSALKLKVDTKGWLGKRRAAEGSLDDAHRRLLRSLRTPTDVLKEAANDVMQVMGDIRWEPPGDVAPVSGRRRPCSMLEEFARLRHRVDPAVAFELRVKATTHQTGACRVVRR